MIYGAYGILIDSEVDLGRQLNVEANSPDGQLITVHLYGGDPDRSLLTHETPVVGIHGREVCSFTDRPLTKVESGQPWCMEVSDVVRFHWQVGCRDIRFHLLEEGNPERLAFWLAHIFLPVYLTLERVFVFLHASAVVIDGEAVLFVGPTKGGKSTLLEFFLRHGHQLLSDDKLALREEDERFVAFPSHGRYRPYRENEDLGWNAASRAIGRHPVRGIYRLEKVGATEPVVVQALSGASGFQQVFGSLLYRFLFEADEPLAFLSRLLDTVPFFSVAVPQDLERLEDVYKAICRHERSLDPGAFGR